MARLILLDRDGVINFDSPAFIKTPEEWRPVPGALSAIARLKRQGWLVAVCSNQSGVGRGLITPDALEAIHEKLRQCLSQLEVSLDGLAFCPHHPDEHCRCRKPAPGMLLEMMSRLGASADECIVVGDSLRDIEAGKAAGCRTVLVRTGNGSRSEAAARALGVDAVFDDLAGFASAVTGSDPCC